MSRTHAIRLRVRRRDTASSKEVLQRHACLVGLTAMPVRDAHGAAAVGVTRVSLSHLSWRPAGRPMMTDGLGRHGDLGVRQPGDRPPLVGTGVFRSLPADHVWVRLDRPHQTPHAYVADVILSDRCGVAGQPAKWAAETLASYPGCTAVAAVTGPRCGIVGLRGGLTITVADRDDATTGSATILERLAMVASMVPGRAGRADWTGCAGRVRSAGWRPSHDVVEMTVEVISVRPAG